MLAVNLVVVLLLLNNNYSLYTTDLSIHYTVTVSASNWKSNWKNQGCDSRNEKTPLRKKEQTSEFETPVSKKIYN